MTDTAPAPTTITITVDGQTIDAKPGEMIIAAAERAGIYIPRFCYHPRMRPVGVCRMCLVEVVGPRGPMLQPACFVPVAEGQEVITDSRNVKKAQDGVLEFLLVNHPLDCPVCDKGGECPLQDQTFTYGPGETRFVEEKRHWEKPIALSDLVLIDRERCIQCDRCTRFADDVAGDPLIEFIGRGASTEVNTFPDDPFSSYFSGNTVQICPVGALLAKPYRFKARPWDLEQVESTCTVCAVGCRIAVQSSQDELTRYLGLDSDPVNHGWLCDKGRFSYESANSERRLGRPLVKKADLLEVATWADALEAAAQGLSDAKTAFGPSSVGVIGGARLPNEDQYAWVKLAKSVLGTDNVDAQIGDGLPAEAVLGLPRATIDDLCNASSVILLTGDIKEELPVLYLRLRGAVREREIPLIELTSRRTGMTKYATRVVSYLPGEAASAVEEVLNGDARSELGASPVVVLGRPSVAEPASSVLAGAALLADVPGIRFLSGLRRGNVHGALELGMAPGMLPGRVTLDAARSWFVDAWGAAPEARGLDTEGMLRAAADGKIQGLVLLGADPIGDFPDRELATRALERANFVVAVDTFLTESTAKANVVLPAAMFTERPGTTTNIEGRITRLAAKVTSPDVSWPDWMIAVELAVRLGGDLGFESLESVWDEIERVAPSFAGVTRSMLSSKACRDGVVVPLGTEAPREASLIDASADPSSTPGVLAPDTHGDTELDGQNPEPSTEADVAPAARPDVALVTWDRTVDPPREVKPDAYALRLVAIRKLYDDGVIVATSPSLSSLAAAPVLKVNPHDLDRLGVRSGGTVRLRSSRLTTTVTVEADEIQPRGSASLPINLPGLDSGMLIDVSAPVNEIGIETV